jgi:hypothetical protein
MGAVRPDRQSLRHGPLAGTLVFLSQSRDVVLAGTALFAMAMGMSMPLLLLGASAGHWLPRSGAWMHAVKRFFGLLLVGWRCGWPSPRCRPRWPWPCGPACCWWWVSCCAPSMPIRTAVRRGCGCSGRPAWLRWPTA